MATNKTNATNKLAEKLKAKAELRDAEFRNKYIDGKDFVTFPDFRDQLENKVKLACVTKLRKHVKLDNGENATDENGGFIWEELFAFVDARFPENWSFGGSALKAIYNDLVDDDMTEDEVNAMLAENPLEFKLKNKKLENGRNKGKTMVQWLNS